MTQQELDAVLDDISKMEAALLRRQKKIVDCGNAVIGELSETMPQWQATKITAAIERLIEAYLMPAPRLPMIKGRRVPWP